MKGKIILTGRPASPGIVKGKIVIIKNFVDVSRMKKGGILVTVMTSPPWLPIMVKASAVITERGGILSHPAIVCRELGIPAIVAAEDATIKLKNGSIVLVDGFTGKIYENDE